MALPRRRGPVEAAARTWLEGYTLTGPARLVRHLRWGRGHHGDGRGANILRERLPYFATRVVNVVNLMTLSRRAVHPHGMDEKG